MDYCVQNILYDPRCFVILYISLALIVKISSLPAKLSHRVFFFIIHKSTKADNIKRPLTPAPCKTSDIIISLINRAILAGW